MSKLRPGEYPSVRDVLDSLAGHAVLLGLGACEEWIAREAEGLGFRVLGRSKEDLIAVIKN